MAKLTPFYSGTMALILPQLKDMINFVFILLYRRCNRFSPFSIYQLSLFSCSLILSALIVCSLSISLFVLYISSLSFFLSFL